MTKCELILSLLMILFFLTYPKNHSTAKVVYLFEREKDVEFFRQ